MGTTTENGFEQVHGYIDVFKNIGDPIPIQMYPLTVKHIKIGREHSCEIRIHNLRVSRLQCSLNVFGEEDGISKMAQLKNLTAKPTTIFKNQGIQQDGTVDLVDGDRFRLYDTELRWRAYNPNNKDGQPDRAIQTPVFRLSLNMEGSSPKSSSKRKSDRMDKSGSSPSSSPVRSSMRSSERKSSGSLNSSSSSPSDKGAQSPKRRRNSDMDMRKAVLKKTFRKSVHGKSFPAPEDLNNLQEGGGDDDVEEQEFEDGDITTTPEDNSQMSQDQNPTAAPDVVVNPIEDDLILLSPFTTSAVESSNDLMQFDTSYEAIEREMFALHHGETAATQVEQTSIPLAVKISLSSETDSFVEPETSAQHNQSLDNSQVIADTPNEIVDAHIQDEIIAADVPNEVLAAEVPNEVVAADNQDEVIAASTQDEVIAASTQDEIIAADTQDEIIAADTQDEIIAADTQDEDGDAGTQDEVIADDTQDEVIADDTQDEVIADDTQDEDGDAGTQDEVIADDTQDEVIADDTQNEIIADDTQDEDGDAGTQDEVIADDTQDKIIAADTQDEDGDAGTPDDVVVPDSPDYVNLADTPDEVVIADTPYSVIIPDSPDELLSVDTPADVVVPDSPAYVTIADSPDEIFSVDTPDEVIVADTPYSVIIPDSPDELLSVDTPADVVVPDSPAYVTIADSPDEIFSVDTPDEVIVADTPDSVIIPDSPDYVIIADTPSAIVNANIQDEGIAADTQDEVIAADTQDEVIADDTQDEVIADDTQDEVIADDTQDGVIAADTQDEVIAADTQDGVIAADTQDESVSSDTDNDLPDDPVSPDDNVIANNPDVVAGIRHTTSGTKTCFVVLNQIHVDHGSSSDENEEDDDDQEQQKVTEEPLNSVMNIEVLSDRTNEPKLLNKSVAKVSNESVTSPDSPPRASPVKLRSLSIVVQRLSMKGRKVILTPAKPPTTRRGRVAKVKKTTPIKERVPTVVDIDLSSESEEVEASPPKKSKIEKKKEAKERPTRRMTRAQEKSKIPMDHSPAKPPTTTRRGRVAKVKKTTPIKEPLPTVVDIDLSSESEEVEASPPKKSKIEQKKEVKERPTRRITRAQEKNKIPIDPSPAKPPTTRRGRPAKVKKTTPTKERAPTVVDIDLSTESEEMEASPPKKSKIEKKKEAKERPTRRMTRAQEKSKIPAAVSTTSKSRKM